MPQETTPDLPESKERGPAGGATGRACYITLSLYIALIFLADFSYSISLIVLFLIVTPFVFVLVSFSLLMWRTDIRTLLFMTFAACMLLSIFRSHWPLKLRFAISKSALQAAVVDGHAGKQLTAPAWYGLYRPTKIRVFGNQKNSAVAFDESWVRGSFKGVVYAPQDIPGRLNYERPIKLDKDWYFVLGD